MNKLVTTIGLAALLGAGIAAPAAAHPAVGTHLAAAAAPCGDVVTDYDWGTTTMRRLEYRNCSASATRRIATRYEFATCKTILPGEVKTLAYVNRSYYPGVGMSGAC